MRTDACAFIEGWLGDDDRFLCGIFRRAVVIARHASIRPPQIDRERRPFSPSSPAVLLLSPDIKALSSSILTLALPLNPSTSTITSLSIFHYHQVTQHPWIRAQLGLPKLRRCLVIDHSQQLSQLSILSNDHTCWTVTTRSRHNYCIATSSIVFSDR